MLPHGLAARLVTAADADYVVGAVQRAMDEGFVRHAPDKASVLSIVSDPDFVGRVFTLGSQHVGHVLLSGFISGEGIIELRLVVTTERQRGFGRVAIQWAVDYVFGTTAANRLWLEVVADNHVARGLYQSVGFVQEGIWRQGYPDPRGGYRDLAAYGLLRSDLP